MAIPSFDEYLSSLGRLTPHEPPMAVTPVSVAIKEAAESLKQLDEVTVESVAGWAAEHWRNADVLGLVVGMGLEKLRNAVMDAFDTGGWKTLAKERSVEYVTMLDDQFDVIRQLTVQRSRGYDFGDLLVARAGGRVTATRAGRSGRDLEDAIEAIANKLKLPYETRTRFTGRNGTAPADLAIPDGANAVIAVAAKGFDSTGSKLRDAVREIAEMAEVRLPRQYIMAAVDGIGWKSRKYDLQRIYDLWASNRIEGLYSLASMDRFEADLLDAARRNGLLP